ncbi:NADPH-dependent F420 reductase [Novosphingobium aerophilum]|uniref:NADPH-dependent F420 reductase n=1 Tax=Novosphingobium TaxID=165696 RepID=UPI0006C8421E|nr:MULTISPECIES: NADPH-dependent F420 reductase [unclassified Novosphingobium]KPH58666.1 F420-dependent NADP reductase [Novosphingobium sp. ST904]TCM42118.1 reduced coenzyme F420:NADP oxidoreductase [Novosphingobium sp. ST904]WRT91389.1 NADPH-dependent F420 reductase [Novosphingobium sp. RL4]
MAAIAVIGGTGALGKGIARRLVQAGHEVTIGSRTADKAQVTAGELGAAGHAENVEAARGKDVVIVAVPHASQGDTLRQIRDAVGNAVVVDTTVPLVPPKVMRVQLPAEGSAAMQAREHLGPDARLVTAFHNVSAHHLDSDHAIDCDVLVFSDDVEARNTVVGLCPGMGIRGLSGGALANSAAAEALTSILIYMNKTYKADGAGIRFTNLAQAPLVP